MWNVIGWAGLEEESLLWVGMGRDRMGFMEWWGTGDSAIPGWCLLSHSPGCDSHHGAAGVSGGGRGDTSVPDLLCNWPARACVPVVLWEAGGEVPLCHTEQGPCTLSMVMDPQR